MGGANVEGEKEFSFSFFLRAYSSTRTLSPAISAVSTRAMKLGVKLLALYEKAANENKSMIYDWRLLKV